MPSPSKSAVDTRPSRCGSRRARDQASGSPRAETSGQIPATDGGLHPPSDHGGVGGQAGPATDQGLDQRPQGVVPASGGQGPGEGAQGGVFVGRAVGGDECSGIRGDPRVDPRRLDREIPRSAQGSSHAGGLVPPRIGRERLEGLGQLGWAIPQIGLQLAQHAGGHRGPAALLAGLHEAARQGHRQHQAQAHHRGHGPAVHRLVVLGGPGRGPLEDRGGAGEDRLARHEALEVVGQRAAAGVPIRGGAGHRLVHHRPQIRGHVGPSTLTQRPGAAGRQHLQDLQGLPRQRRASGQGLVQHGPQGVLVRGGSGAAGAGRDLGGHVHRRPQHLVGSGQGTLVGPQLQRQAEVHQAGVAALAQQHVARLDVAVDEGLIVGDLKAPGQGRPQPSDLDRRQPAPIREEIPQGRPVDQGHGEEEHVVGTADVEHPDHRRVVELSRPPRLPQQPLHLIGGGVAAPQEHLQGDGPQRADRSVHHPHRPPTDLLEQPVGADPASGGRRPGRPPIPTARTGPDSVGEASATDRTGLALGPAVHRGKCRPSILRVW